MLKPTKLTKPQSASRPWLRSTYPRVWGERVQITDAGRERLRQIKEADHA